MALDLNRSSRDSRGSRSSSTLHWKLGLLQANSVESLGVDTAAFEALQKLPWRLLFLHDRVSRFT